MTERPAGERPGTGNPANGATRAEAVRVLTNRIAIHRKRVATIERLRDLATAKNDRAKLTRLAELEATEQAMFDREMNKAKELLGDAQFDALMDKVGMKPGARVGQNPREERGNGDNPREERGGDNPREERGGDTDNPREERGGDNPREERGGDTPTERPQERPTERP